MIRIRQLPALSNLRGDIAGAFDAAVISFPQSIGYGLVAFAPLGMEFAGHAAVLGIYSAVFAGFLAALIGSTPVQITGPKVPLTLLTGVVVADLAARLPPGVTGDTRLVLILGGVAFCVLVGGTFQIALGASRLGRVIKFVPYPVVSGFMNGVALLLIWKQIAPLLGATGNVSLPELVGDPTNIQPWALMVGCVTLATVFLSKRLIRRVSPYLVGLLTGTALYYGIRAMAGAPDLGPVIGTVDFEWPQLINPVEVFDAAAGLDLLVFMPALLIAGLSLGLVGSLESLFSSVVSDNLVNQRHDSSRELMGQGIGNIACAIVGALPAAGSIPRSQANFNAGGRTRLSGMLCAVFVFCFFSVLAPLVGKIPLAAISGMLIYVGFDLVDSWTVNLLRKLKAEIRQRKEVIFDMGVAFTVAILTITANLVVAVGAGVAAASLLFIHHMGKSVIRRKYDGGMVRSRKMRGRKQDQYLAEYGRRIMVIELQGPIFFGSGDRLMGEFDNTLQDVRYFVLDMKRVTEIDSTGTRLLPQIKRLIEKDGRYLLISHLTDGHPLWKFLDFMGVVEALGAEYFHADTDAALEWAEEHLLDQPGGLHDADGEITLESMSLTDGFSDAELACLRQRMGEESYGRGEMIFGEGDHDPAMLVIVRGTVTIRQKMQSRDQLKRVFSYGPGSVIGELALLDKRERSAGAWADTGVLLMRLSHRDFDVLKEEAPQLALKLLTNLAREVSMKLRRTSAELAALEDSA